MCLYRLEITVCVLLLYPAPVCKYSIVHSVFRTVKAQLTSSPLAYRFPKQDSRGAQGIADVLNDKLSLITLQLTKEQRMRQSWKRCEKINSSLV